MSDLIDRQAAVEIVTQCHHKAMSGSDWIRMQEACVKLADLPTAQPHSNDSSATRKALDCISRQAAIEHYRVTDPAGTFAYCNSIIEFLESLPSAQPEYTEQDMRDEFSAGYDCGMEAARHEIIRCKDCKWHSGEYYCLNTDTYGFDGNDFCSAAERREE